jgi:hypothetical protein
MFQGCIMKQSSIKKLFRSGCPVANEKGAGGVLPLMFSTMGGVLFLFSFYNLTQFTAAKSAADQAARRAARCLSVSDSNESCRSIIPNNEQIFTEAEWFGYPRMEGPGDVQLDLYRYAGNVYREEYGANYNSYEVNTGSHIVNWNEKRVRPHRFVGLLNSYARLRADVTQKFINRNTGEVRSCTLTNAVEVPFGLDFTENVSYINTDWCAGINDSDWRRDPVCSNLDSGWTPLTHQEDFLTCVMNVPLPRQGEDPNTDQPWLLLGGEPTCRDVPDNARMNFEELNNFYDSRTNVQSSAAPGQINRAFPVTNGRQFMVVTVFSCNPQAFMERLRNGIRNSREIINHFTTYPSIEINHFLNAPGGDYQRNSNPDELNAFLYNSAPGMSFIAPQDWTYIEWYRHAGGATRKLTREICEWVPYEEAIEKWEEFLPFGHPENPLSHSPSPSGVELLGLPEYVFVDVPSCLQADPVPSEVTQYTCGNITIAGQHGSFNQCAGWDQTESERTRTYQLNLQEVVSLNSNPIWSSYETLPLDGFETRITPQWSTEMGSSIWNFSWSRDIFMGMQILNPGAVRPRAGYNPKSLPNDETVKRYRKNSESLNQINERKKALLLAIINKEGVGSANLSEVIDPFSIFEEIQMGEERVPIVGIWPFIAEDGAGLLPVPQPRPYVTDPSSKYDYNLDCQPTNYCGSTTQFQSIEEALRQYANPALPDVDLTDTSIDFYYSEQKDRTVTMAISELESGYYPACSQFKTSCDRAQRRGELTSLGTFSQIPGSCMRRDFLDCFPRYNASHSLPQYEISTNYNAARMLALGEVRRLMPGATFCGEGATQNCVNVNINEFGNEARVEVSFVAPITSPFREILSSNVITVRANKRELIEIERLRK